METFLFVIVGIACLLSICVLWLVFSSYSLRKKNSKLHEHITITESELIRLKEYLHHSEKKSSKNQDQQVSNFHANELLDLRRDIAKLKEDNKKLKDDLRVKDIDMKKIEALHIDKLYLITKERNTLVSQLKELDASHHSKTQHLEQTLHALNAEREELVERAHTFEKQSKNHIAKTITLQSKLKVAEQEINKLKNVETNNQGANDILLNRWKERALCARQMYQLMRQMRELSDNKVSTYQDGIIAIAEWILKQTNTSVPSIADNENKADRLLAEAWTIVISNSYVQNPAAVQDASLETRV